MTGCLPSLLRPSLGLGDARSCLDLAVRQAIDKLGLIAPAFGRGQPTARRARAHRQARHLVDATIIAGAVRRPSQGGGVNPRDPDRSVYAQATGQEGLKLIFASFTSDPVAAIAPCGEGARAQRASEAMRRIVCYGR